jgi:hypothetical protein
MELALSFHLEPPCRKLKRMSGGEATGRFRFRHQRVPVGSSHSAQNFDDNLLIAIVIGNVRPLTGMG